MIEAPNIKWATLPTSSWGLKNPFKLRDTNSYNFRSLASEFLDLCLYVSHEV